MKITKFLLGTVLATAFCSSSSYAKKKKITCSPPSAEASQIVNFNNSAYSELRKAMANLRRKEYTKVIDIADDLLKNEDINAANALEAYQLKARSLFKLGRVSETIKTLESARDAAKSQRSRDEYIGYLQGLNNDGKFTHKKDDDPVALVKIPPIMPRKAEKSGHCDLIFDFDTKAWEVTNIRVLFCSDPIFVKPSKKALSKWRFNTTNSSATNKDTEATIRYRLMDECGNILPE